MMRPRLSLAQLPLVILLLLALGLGYALLRTYSSDKAARFASHVGKPAPAAMIDGYDPATWRGKLHAVNFFASWCLPCRAEHEVMAQLATVMPVIGIAYRDQPDATQQFLTSLGNHYALVAHDPVGRGALEWGLTGVPETFVVDAAGVIRFHLSGPLTPEIMARELMPLVQP
jgi:cytochrome c biogenesis protein CcmG/thiol:disulfide interchange protein DsbE